MLFVQYRKNKILKPVSLQDIHLFDIWFLYDLKLGVFLFLQYHLWH